MGQFAAVFRALAITALFAAGAATAGAQEKSPCDQFSWPLDQERAWFSAPRNRARSGAELGTLTDGAFAVMLESADAVSYVLPPESAPKKPSSMGAVIGFAEVAKAGRFQVTLSDEAWVDMIQANAYTLSVEHTGVRGCQGLRKSVRFVLKQAPLVIQLSGASASQMLLAIRRLD